MPASVVTSPAGVILRITALSSSATYTLPALSTATPFGKLNRAALPEPSVLPKVSAWPARVVTVPSLVILRMVLLPVSATYRLPLLSQATLRGLLNDAAAPTPLLLPLTPNLPAKVVTTPAEVILRITLLDE